MNLQGAAVPADTLPIMGQRTVRHLPVPSGSAGPVMVIGGAEDRVRDKVILGRFARFAGGHDGHVVVISTASSLGDAATEAYRELFLGLGIGRVSGLRPDEREEADDPGMAKTLADAIATLPAGATQGSP